MARHHRPRQREAHEQELDQTPHLARLSQGWFGCKFCFFPGRSRAHGLKKNHNAGMPPPMRQKAISEHLHGFEGQAGLDPCPPHLPMTHAPVNSADPRTPIPVRQAVFKVGASPVFAGHRGKNQGALTAPTGSPAAGTPPSGSVDFLEAGAMTKVSSKSLRNPRS